MFVSVRKTLYAAVYIISLCVSFNHICAAPVINLEHLTDDSAMFITWTYNETPMALYIPKSTGKPLPLVMYLHYCTGNPLYEDFWIIPSLNAIEPCFVFLPTAIPIENNCADWGGTYDESLRPAMLNALRELDSILRGTAIDKNRQYLYGESMGGEGVYRLLMDFPTRFAGAVSVVGYTKDRGAESMAQTPLWIIHGEKDGTNPVENDRIIYQSILDAGGTMVKYTEYPDLDHVPAMEKARIEPDLFTWLLSNKRATGINFRQLNKKVGAFNCDISISCKTGKLHFSKSLPQGTALRLFDLNGKLIYSTIASGKSVCLQKSVIRKVSLWQLSHSSFSGSGMIVPE